ncbi:unnamed protein product [Oppiella nova]|uniref:Uncharacterized protein n=1 Tax=Oppiella nova TaxID=334625 RepID=A0A7R9QCF2_9ACAR|nr:unnamed protein product [Oppiella nova]CAG2162959.1 unnamed protein product [Oppiella nova]
MPVDSRFQRKMTGKLPIKEYKFVGPLYLYKVPNESGKYRLIGFNQVWLGCPQPLCISPGFDAILSAGSIYAGSPGYIYHGHHGRENMIIVFRGNYFWHYDLSAKRAPKHPPLTDWAVRVADRFIDHRYYRYSHYTTRKSRLYPKTSSSSFMNDSMVVPTYIDAIVPGINKYNNCIYFFKDDQFVCYELFSTISAPMKISNEWKSTEPTWKSARFDAAFHIKSFIYFIAGQQIWCFTSDRIACHKYPMKLTDIHKDFPKSITTAFQHQDFLYIIKGSLYYKIPVSKFPSKISHDDLEAKYIFQDLLGCDEGMYTAWGFDSYDYFIENFAKRMQNENSYSSETHFNPTFLIVSKS